MTGGILVLVSSRPARDPAAPSPRRAAGPRRAPSPEQRQRDPERTRARILEAAVEEFSAKGFAGARVSDIAERAGVNQQLIAYYFDSKEGLYREVGRRWRSYEAENMPQDAALSALIGDYVRTSVDPRLGARLLAWDGLSDAGDEPDPDEARERDARLQQEVESIRRRQRDGEIDAQLDPEALTLILMGAANALAVYPQLARGIFGGRDGSSPELVQHYAGELAAVITLLAPRDTKKPR
jgi:TetR/AcrR family transcriptional regulator